jgi:putative hydrolase of the HAD superfamily
LTGYGTKAFTLSLIENAVRISHEQLTGDIVMKLLDLGKELLNFPTTPLPEVEDTLQRLSELRRFRLVVFTKGELMDQEGKLRRSGLEQYFSHVETVSNKTETEYRQLCENLGVAPEETLMVGNSFRSDIAPALAAGAWAAHIPYHVVWELEKSEEFPHERLRKITHFGELLEIVC